ncbi:MAG TPA: PAS domain S-box protein [Anaerolineae bacterium]|nr:PAS domain S-box protein [Anaerolineae bacterium]
MIAHWRSIFSHWLDTRATDLLAQRRGRLLALFLLTASVMMMMLLLIDFADLLTGAFAGPTWIVSDFSALAFMLGLFLLNRRGKVRLAAYGALAAVIGITTLLIPLDTLNNSLVLYALPIALSSFVVFPAASLGVAALSISAYMLLNLLQKSGGYFNYLGVLALCLLAVTIWMVADWLQRTVQQAQTAADELRADIAERKQTEVALIASEERYRTLAQEQQAINAQLETYYSDALTVHEVSRALAATLDSVGIYRLLYREIVQQLLGAAHLMVALYDSESQIIRCGYAALDGQEVDLAQFPPLALGIGPTSDTIRTREARIIDLAELRAVPGPQGRTVRIGDPDDQAPMSALYVPLIRGERIVGVLSIQHYEPHAFADRHLLLASTIASQAAVALTNAELFATLEQRVAERTAALEAVNRDLAREIAERTQAERLLREIEQRLRAVSEATPIPIVISRLSDTTILSANPPLSDLVGTPLDQLIGQQARAFFASQREFRQLVLRVHRDGSVHNAELQLRRADGVVIWVIVSIQRTTIDGEPALVTGFYDITERKQAESALRESEARFRQITENIHEVFWMSDATASRRFYVSPAYEDIWGCTVASLLTNPESFIETVHPDDRAQVLDYFARQQQGVPAFAEYRILRPDGSIGWIWDRAFPVRDETGRVYRIAGVAEDVTSRKRAEEELHRALDAEKELGELKSRFIAVTSHEFRTPLAGIFSSAELLEHYGHKWPDDKRLRYLRQIQTNVKNMTLLLEEVLIIGKADAHKIEFHPAPLELDRFCRDLVEELQLSNPSHTIHLTSTVPSGCWDLDEQLLRHILINLLSNAVKYSPAADSIELDVTQPGRDLVFRVSDHGLGIPPEAHARLFETFYRAGNVAGIQGTGLGLSIVKKSVELCGGTISFTSEVGQGTTFTVTLPAHSSPLQEFAHVGEDSGH